MTITSITRIASDCIEKEKTVAKRARRKIEFVSKVPIISSGRKLLASHEDSQTVSGPEMSVGGRDSNSQQDHRTYTNANSRAVKVDIACYWATLVLRSFRWNEFVCAGKVVEQEESQRRAKHFLGSKSLIRES